MRVPVTGSANPQAPQLPSHTVQPGVSKFMYLIELSGHVKDSFITFTINITKTVAVIVGFWYSTAS